MSSASVTDRDRPPIVLSAQPSQPLTPQGSFPVFASFFFSSSSVFVWFALARALKPMLWCHGGDTRRFGRASRLLFHPVEEHQRFVDDANQAAERHF